VTSSAATQRTAHWSALALIVACLFFYFAYLHQHAINVPLADDIDDALMVANTTANADSAREVLEALFTQHNDHRTLATRSTYLAVLGLTGELNFRTLNFLSNLALPALLLLLWQWTRNRQHALLALLPAALLLLQLRAYGITFWAMAAFAYFYVFLYGFLAIHFLHRVAPWRFALAAVCAGLGTFTLASGPHIWLVGLVSLLHQCWRPGGPRPLGYVLTWLLLAAVTLLSWRIDLATPNTLSAMLGHLIEEPGHLLLYTLTLLGNIASDTSVIWAALCGAILLVVTAVLTLRHFRDSDIRVELACWLVIASAAAMAMGRWFAPVDYGLSSRYAFPSTLLAACCWTLLAYRIQPSLRGLVLTVVLAGAFYFHSWQHYSAALQPYMEKRVASFNRGNFPAWPHPLKLSNAAVAESIELGIYKPPTRPLPPAEVVVFERN
jgi:hypothetical protein